MLPLPNEDLDHVLENTRPLWEELRGQRLFITGGTGFFGIWLLESFAHANRVLGLKAETVVLSRHPAEFLARRPHLASESCLKLIEGDVRDFRFPEGGFSHVIHAATAAGAETAYEQPLVLLDTMVAGTRRVLDFAAQAGTRRLLFTSSGAVYGKQPPELTHIPEDYVGAPDPLDSKSTYGEGKRMAEHLCALFARKHGYDVKIARCFAFVGPHLPLDAHFAIGNFIRDALRGGPIQVNGDGTPLRSYLHAADLAVWLWVILLKGRSCRAYNVGSDTGVSIAELAGVVANTVNPSVEVIIAKQSDPQKPPERYVPCTARVRDELGLRQKIGLPEAARRTVEWCRRQQTHKSWKN
jgi:dTDP-glucose 4,6-dehydratase